ncbi:MAG: divalent-cation tolerance protein CutA [Acidobacteriota bacterium]|nr:divalent-cation tolerance protein CutA [Acidobacteriota bacterium]
MSDEEPRATVVLTTVPVDLDAEALARTLVEERLAACVNVLPRMRSIYRWNGDVESASERQLVIKTSAARVGGLRERLHTLHPYDVPEFLVLDVADGSDAYLRWLREQTDRP